MRRRPSPEFRSRYSDVLAHRRKDPRRRHGQFGSAIRFCVRFFGNQKTVLRGGYGSFITASFRPVLVRHRRIRSRRDRSTLDLLAWVSVRSGTAATFALSGRPARFQRRAVPRPIRDRARSQDRDGTAMVVEYPARSRLWRSTGRICRQPRHASPDRRCGQPPQPEPDGRRSLESVLHTSAALAVRRYFPRRRCIPRSTYNSLQANFKRNLSKGLRFNANYTWGHAIDDVVGFFKDYQNPNSTPRRTGKLGSGRATQFCLDAGYEIPFREWFGDGFRVDRRRLEYHYDHAVPHRPAGQRRPGRAARSAGFRYGRILFRVSTHTLLRRHCVRNYSVPECQFNAAAFTVPAGTFTPGNAAEISSAGPVSHRWICR